MAGSALSTRTVAQTLGGRKRKGKTTTGFFGTHSTGKSAGRARRQVDWCCNCTRNSNCLTLGQSTRTSDCWNTWRQCTDCVFWSQCKNCGAFLPRTPGEVLLGHFRVAEHVPPSNPSHLRAPLAAHRTEGGRAERGEQGATLRRGGKAAGRTVQASSSLSSGCSCSTN